MNLLLINILGWALHALTQVLFFRELKEGSYAKAVPALLLTGCLYITKTSVPLAFLIKMLACLVYLKLLRKDLSFSQILYFSLLFNDAFFASRLFFSLSVARELGLASFWSARLSSWAVFFLVMYVISSSIPFEDIPVIRPMQWMIMGSIGTMLVLGEDTVTKAITLAHGDLGFLIYQILVILFTLLVIALLDAFLAGIAKEKRNNLIENDLKNQYLNLQTRLEATEDVRRIYHDLRNHIEAIKSISSEEQIAYMESIENDLNAYKDAFSTGNKTLDGLFSSKMRPCREKAIALSVKADLSMVKQLDPVDVIAIFGNALDNAIEAQERAGEEDSKYIILRSWCYADQLMITLTNSVFIRTVMKNGLPATTKKDPHHHGLGTESIQKAVLKYGGTVAFDFSEDGKDFILSIMLPLQEKADKVTM